MLNLNINGRLVQIEDTDKITMHVQDSTDWSVTYFGHRSDDMDVVLERHRGVG
jgi:hypothetical protein